MNEWEGFPEMIGEQNLTLVEALRAEVRRLRAIPPHPAHVPVVRQPPGGGGVLVQTVNGWVLVTPHSLSDKHWCDYCEGPCTQ